MIATWNSGEIEVNSELILKASQTTPDAKCAREGQGRREDESPEQRGAPGWRNMRSRWRLGGPAEKHIYERDLQQPWLT